MAEEAAAGSAFPRLEEYLNSLPNGLQSYPECQGKASLFRIALELQPVRKLPELPDSVRPRLLRYFDNTLPPNQWVPELDYVLFTILMADLHGWDAAALRRFWCRVMDQITSSAMYGLLFRFLSARMLVTTVASRWSSFHTGTRCSAERTADGLGITLGYPRGLFPPLIVHAYVGVFDSLAAHSRLFKGQVELVSSNETEARYLMRDLVDG